MPPNRLGLIPDDLADRQAMALRLAARSARVDPARALARSPQGLGHASVRKDFRRGWGTLLRLYVLLSLPGIPHVMTHGASETRPIAGQSRWHVSLQGRDPFQETGRWSLGVGGTFAARAHAGGRRADVRGARDRRRCRAMDSRDLDPEDRALADGRSHASAATVGLAQPLHRGQTEPDAVLALGLMRLVAPRSAMYFMAFCARFEMMLVRTPTLQHAMDGATLSTRSSIPADSAAGPMPAATSSTARRDQGGPPTG